MLMKEGQANKPSPLSWSESPTGQRKPACQLGERSWHQGLIRAKSNRVNGKTVWMKTHVLEKRLSFKQQSGSLLTSLSYYRCRLKWLAAYLGR